MTDREEELDRIRSTYARYRAEGRKRLWAASNRGYARMAADRDAALLALLRRTVPSAGGRVLDVGCGDGRLASMARAAGIRLASWIGIDLDPEAVSEAARANPGAGFHVASADRIPFPAASFDIAVASTLFSSLPSESLQRAVAGEVARVLEPGGWLLWYDLRYDNPGNADVHGISAMALDRLFPSWHTETSSMTLLPPVARRLNWATPLAYPVLHGLPLLRSHLVGRLQRPQGEHASRPGIRRLERDA